MSTTRSVLSTVLCIGIVGCGPAFPAPPTVTPLLLVRPETRVRLDAPAASPDPIEGRWLGEEGGDIRIGTEEGHEFVVARSQVRRAEISTERRRNALWGAVIGMVATGIPSAIYWSRECEGSCRAPAVSGFLLGGGLYGALPGAVIGALIRTRRWELWTGFDRASASPSPAVGIRWVIPRRTPSAEPRR
ncbi:MAG: hypothetical protein KJO11_11260 [Gemmatimonadetes bacterium]|nr:hypothetical protein [Gemmatimonadota bacterium]MBT8404555.1 hypothetical protein [Gemmatimonadota bacterium]NNF37666.1 hypothetical protein [Gemmatimonadota bacterium]NNK62805.1 hypothetical protein [Gemmatimonadota bacterium]